MLVVFWFGKQTLRDDGLKRASADGTGKMGVSHQPLNETGSVEWVLTETITYGKVCERFKTDGTSGSGDILHCTEGMDANCFSGPALRRLWKLCVTDGGERVHVRKSMVLEGTKGASITTAGVENSTADAREEDDDDSDDIKSG